MIASARKIGFTVKKNKRRGYTARANAEFNLKTDRRNAAQRARTTRRRKREKEEMFSLSPLKRDQPINGMPNPAHFHETIPIQ